MSEHAWKAYQTSKCAKFYLDLAKYRDGVSKGQTPTTPAISLFFGLQESLRLIRQEGMPDIFQRHERLMQRVRQGVRSKGLTLFVEDTAASRAVTAILPPTGVAADDIRKVMKKKFRVIVAGGQEELKGRIFRIGHLGYVAAEDMETALGALEGALAELQAPVARS